jgi:hypothetical protein
MAMQLAVRSQRVEVCKYLLENDSFTSVKLAERLGDGLGRAELLWMPVLYENVEGVRMRVMPYHSYYSAEEFPRYTQTKKLHKMG